MPFVKQNFDLTQPPWNQSKRHIALPAHRHHRFQGGHIPNLRPKLVRWSPDRPGRPGGHARDHLRLAARVLAHVAAEHREDPRDV